jgi:tetratricopeptide (TPR) repeat protein
MLSLPILFLSQAVALPPQAQRAEDWSRALVASEHYATGDADARIAEWAALVAQEPASPLTTVTLLLIDATEPAFPLKAAERVLALPDANVHPLAAGRLAAMKAARRLAVAGRGAEGSVDLYPEHLTRASLLAPLAGSLLDHEADALLAQPAFSGSRPLAPWGRPVAWRALERGPTVRSFDIDTASRADSGWCLLSLDFEVRGGTGWFELDFSEAQAPHWVSLISPWESGFRGSSGVPHCRVAFDDGSVREIDFLSAERSPLWREGRAWRDGHNRVLVALPLGSGMNVGARVLDSTGRARSVAPVADVAAALGSGKAGPASPEPLVGAIEFLEQLPARGPYAEALLGYAKFHDGRFAEGVSHVETALELAPEDWTIAAFAVELFQTQSSLPDTWRRARATELVEKALAGRADHVGMRVAHARILAPEDREEEAIRALEPLRTGPRSAAVELELANLYEKLELEAQAERSLVEASQRVAGAIEPALALAQHREDQGLTVLGREAREAAAELGNTSALDALATLEQTVGNAEAALALRREIARRTRSFGADIAVANELEELGRFDEATKAWAELEARYPAEPYFTLQAADCARRLGDAAAEQAALQRTLAIEPSNRAARERLASDPANETWKRFALDPAQELAGFDPARWSDHVVRAIDLSVVHVFEDGAFDQWSQEYDVARDLEGCETLGTQGEDGEMLSIATIKRSDGKAYEPVSVNNEYIMPALEPGDAVTRSYRSGQGPQRPENFRTGQFYFASVEMPFFLSRYVISLPKSLGAELLLRNFNGEHEVLDEGAREIHIFTARNVERVVPEPGSPPQDWYLPWVAFRRAPDRAAIERELVEDVVVPTRLAPQLLEAANLASEGTDTETERAIALHRFVTEALDKRSETSRTSALAALLTRDGNGAFLYSALLKVVGIEHELVWSRGVDPAAEPDPENLFPAASDWMNQLFVLVKPRDGEPAWCDMSTKTLPYGKIVANGPNAVSFSATRREWTTLSDIPPAQRAGDAMGVLVTLGEGREATAEVSLDFTGNVGYALKEQLREIPEAQMKRTVTGIVSRVVPGLSVSEYEVLGLKDDAPAAFRAKGSHKRLLDPAGEEFVCKLPFPALGLSGRASGEGERKLPFMLGSSSSNVVRARFVLPAGRERLGEFPEVVEEFRGARYRLAIEDAGPEGFTVVREFVLPAQVIPAAEYAGFVAFARKVDEAERVRLRFK